MRRDAEATSLCHAPFSQPRAWLCICSRLHAGLRNVQVPDLLGQVCQRCGRRARSGLSKLRLVVPVLGCSLLALLALALALGWRLWSCGGWDKLHMAQVSAGWFVLQEPMRCSCVPEMQMLLTMCNSRCRTACWQLQAALLATSIGQDLEAEHQLSTHICWCVCGAQVARHQVQGQLHEHAVWLRHPSPGPMQSRACQPRPRPAPRGPQSASCCLVWCSPRPVHEARLRHLLVQTAAGRAVLSVQSESCRVCSPQRLPLCPSWRWLHS